MQHQLSHETLCVPYMKDTDLLNNEQSTVPESEIADDALLAEEAD